MWCVGRFVDSVFVMICPFEFRGRRSGNLDARASPRRTSDAVKSASAPCRNGGQPVGGKPFGFDGERRLDKTGHDQRSTFRLTSRTHMTNVGHSPFVSTRTSSLGRPMRPKLDTDRRCVCWVGSVRGRFHSNTPPEETPDGKS